MSPQICVCIWKQHKRLSSIELLEGEKCFTHTLKNYPQTTVCIFNTCQLGVIQFYKFRTEYQHRRLKIYEWELCCRDKFSGSCVTAAKLRFCVLCQQFQARSWFPLQHSDCSFAFFLPLSLLSDQTPCFLQTIMVNLLIMIMG